MNIDNNETTNNSNYSNITSDHLENLLKLEQEVAQLSLQKQLQLKERALKSWKAISALSVILAVILAYIQSFDFLHRTFFPPPPPATESDLEKIVDERYIAGRGGENQINNSLRLMATLPKGYKQTALELINTEKFDEALTEYREGFKNETEENITDQEIWNDLKSIAATVSPKLELACIEGSIRNRKISPSERITYSSALKSVGRHNDALQQATVALNEINKSSNFELFHRALSTQNNALFELGRHEEALQGYNFAFSELNNRLDNNANKRSYASAISGLGLIAHKNGDYSLALKSPFLWAIRPKPEIALA